MSSACRVLIVDDVPLNVEILRKVLRKEYALDSAENGEQCLIKVLQFRPQVVLLDIMMPGMNGYETCRRIKALCAGQFVQVILVSGKASAEERLKGYEALADDYLVKPFHHDELLSKVRVQFRLWQARQELAAAKEQIERHAADLEHLVEERTAELTASQDTAVFALARLAESRDTDTGDHLQRLRDSSMAVARRLRDDSPYAAEITPRFLEDLYRAAPLHDIGKVGIADAILLKPGRFTREEFAVMKRHVVIGAETLEDAARRHGGCFLEMAAHIARYHHEWFDGHGYCEGLEGDAIPLSARIVAVADVYDALTSARPYKLPYAPEIARGMIVAESGTHFDPVVVQAFLAVFPELLDGTAPFRETFLAETTVVP